MCADEFATMRKPGRTIMEEFARRPLRVLCPAQVKQIDTALCALGKDGEVRLIKSKGELRFITTVEEEEAF